MIWLRAEDGPALVWGKDFCMSLPTSISMILHLDSNYGNKLQLVLFILHFKFIDLFWMRQHSLNMQRNSSILHTFNRI